MPKPTRNPVMPKLNLNVADPCKMGAACQKTLGKL